MFKYIKKLFAKPSLEELSKIPGSGVIQDEDFGYIRYIKAGDSCFWQMEHDWVLPEYNAKVGCSEIPGDINGPFIEARKFLLSKKEKPGLLWDLCDLELRKNIAQWYPKNKDEDPRNIFVLSSLAMDSDVGSNEWEISFEAKEDYKWTYMSFQLQGNQIVSGTVDT